ncbi:MAG: Phospholipase C [Pleopsidium flavum]|nr:MAG: Phospholipase C [Pleopsidium flavum]
MFGLWTSTLEDVSRYRMQLMAGLAGSGQDENALRAHWRREMAKLFNGNPHRADEENLNFEGIESLCRSLHINCSRNVMRAQFTKADGSKTGKLAYHEFKDFVRRLKERKDIKEIYKGLASDSTEGLNLNEFLTFLTDGQGVDVVANLAYWETKFQQIIRKSKIHCPNSQDVHEENQSRMNFEAFTTFLSSTANNVRSTRASEAKFDRPLNEYFISSSHNTYLLGRQVAGSSSTEAYIRVLQRGCRSVEIDCWDGPEGRPIVSHGRTLTSSVFFSDCISVIGKYAFVSSPYPLFLSLEVHCNPEQQQAMVDIMRGILGDRLVEKPYMTNAFSLPSPEELKHRFLIKVKAGENPVEKTSTTDSSIGRRQRSFSSPFSRPQVLDNSLVPSGPLLSSPPSISPSETSSSFWAPGKGSMTTTSISSTTDESDTAPAAKKEKKKHKSKIIKPLGDLGVYTRGVKYNSFALPESKTYNHIFSLAERTFEALCRDPDTKSQLEKHNQRYMMRVYPSAFRLRSSNFDPLAFWKRGVQMVALNWQTYDLGMQMNDAMFAAGSDRTGYVLKPKELRKSIPSLTSAPGPSSDKVEKKLVKFSVEMISAQQLPRSRGMGAEESLDPYIEIEMLCAEDKAKGVASGEGGLDASARNGLSGIGSPHRRRTIIVQSNGYNPIFNDKFKLSLETKYPSLVFVRWTVWDSVDGRNYGNSSEPLAMFTAKLSSLQQGYRHLPLFDYNGEQFLFSTLFCKIRKEEPVSIRSSENLRLEKIGRLKQFGQSVFKRTLSVERKNVKEGAAGYPS